MKTSNKKSTAAILFAALFALGFSGPLSAHAAGPATVNLQTAGNFTVLSKTGITNVHTSAITGNIGSSPITAAAMDNVFCSEITGTIYGVDAAYTGSGSQTCFKGNPPSGNKTIVDNAVLDMATAYTDAAGRTSPDSTNLFAGNLGGQTITAGLYKWTTDVTIPTSVTLSGGASDVWIFQISGNLSIASGGSVPAGVKVLLTGGALASNIFWQVGGGTGATLGTYSTFNGTILSAKQVIAQTGAVLNGRALAQTQVTLDANTVTGTVTPITTPSSPNSARRDGALTVVKTVVNDNGGMKVAVDFPLFINGVLISSGSTYAFSNPGTYTVTETPDSRYTGRFSGDCNAVGQVTITANDNKICIITNDDIGPAPVVPPVPPLIDIVKVPSPLALPEGPGSVTYTYTLRNIGAVPVERVSIVGDTCSPILLASGDSNSDGRLDVNETWVYGCTITLSQTHTSTVVATGWANGISAVDVANATVIVGAPIVPPLIHVTKIPSPLALFSGGGMVTYTKRVSNPGTTPLSNVSVIDDTCSPVEYISGDTNSNALLEPSEVWIYICRTNLTRTTTNTVQVFGVANTLVARDFAVATVVVAAAVPGFPDTGLSPENTGTPWSVPLLSLGLLIFSISLVTVLRKTRV